MDRGSPGRTLAAIRRGLATVGRALLNAPRALADAAGAAWGGLSTVARRRLAAALAAVVLVVLFLTLAVPNLPCQLPGGDYCAPDDDAEELVPAEALAYLHANLDPETEDYERATEVAERVPVVSGQVIDRVLAGLPGPVGARLDFESDVRPWFGGEAAIVLLPAARRPEQAVLLEVAEADGAEDFANQISVGVGTTEDHEGVELSLDLRGIATAQTDGFLIVGEKAGVEAVIDTATAAEGAESLAGDATAVAVREELPEHRFAEAYLSREGVQELVAGARGALASLSPLVGPGATRGAAASLTATEDAGLELAVRSVLDPDRAESAPGFFAAFPRFDPELPERLADDSLAYLGFDEPRATIGALLAQAGAQAPGVAAGFRALAEDLRDSGIDIERDLLDALGGEAAFALAPQPPEAGAAFPFLEFVADDVDEDAARRALAALQVPLAESVDPGASGQAPVFGQSEAGGVETRSLRISPTVELTYAVFDGLAAIVTDPEGIEQLAGDEAGLDENEDFERATEGYDDDVSLLGYFDLAELVALGERLGLAEDPLYATFAGEFRRLDALGLAVSAEDQLIATDARLLLGEAEADSGQAPAPVPSD